MTKDRKTLGESLLEQNLITEANLKKAEEESKKNNEPLRRALVRSGLISESDIIAFLEKHLNIPFVDIKNHTINPEIITIIPENLARQYSVIPLCKSGDILTVAMVDPLNVLAIDELRAISGFTIEPVIATESDIKSALSQFYFKGSTIDDVLKKIEPSDSSPEEDELSPERLKSVAEEAPIIKLVDLIIIQAVRSGASDIHVEPDEKLLRIRYRIDGILHESSTLPKNIQPAVISRIKIMSDLNIAVKRVPQDGRFQANIEDNKIDFRVSTLPTIYGENVVMRILDSKSALVGLENIGFNKVNFESFQNVIKKPHGIILVTGPTGSGKTTTLYSALSTVNSIEKNVITLEDPVEYKMKLIRQSQINPKAGHTFANGLRSILRQDPDIIMVGEIRDFETAEISIQAALTGHLVFSTLHTNDAPGALTRLTDMGVEPFLISSSINAILAQRLVRKICQSCKGSGCGICNNAGFKGRIGIFEFMTMTEKIRQLVIERASSSVIKKVAREEGMKTLREDGMEKVLGGITTKEEVLRVTQLD